MELDLFAYIAENDPGATFDGQRLEAALDTIRRRQVLGAYPACTAAEAELADSELGIAPLLVLGAIVVVTALLSTAFVVYTRTQLAQHREQTARAKAYVEIQRRCLETTGRQCDLPSDVFGTPESEERLPSWAKGLIGVGIAATVVVVVAVVLPRVLPPRRVSAVAGCTPARRRGSFGRSCAC